MHGLFSNITKRWLSMVGEIEYAVEAGLVRARLRQSVLMLGFDENSLTFCIAIMSISFLVEEK